MKRHFRIILLHPTVGGGSLVTSLNVAKTLEKMGHLLRVIDPWRYRILIKERFLDKDEERINQLTKEVTNEYLIRAIKEFKPDLFLTIFGLYTRDEIFRLLKKEGIPSCCWFLDDPWGFEKASKIARRYDFFLPMNERP